MCIDSDPRGRLQLQSVAASRIFASNAGSDFPPVRREVGMKLASVQIFSKIIAAISKVTKLFQYRPY